jgi:hypothetical protein
MGPSEVELRVVRAVDGHHVTRDQQAVMNAPLAEVQRQVYELAMRPRRRAHDTDEMAAGMLRRDDERRHAS